MDRLFRFGFATLVLLAVGCGPSGPELVPVSGRVLLDGQPLPAKSVFFIPADGTGGLGAGANTKSDGSYELIAVYPGAVKDMPGIPAGKYKVVVSEPRFPIETEMAVQGQSSEPEVAIDFAQPTPPKASQPKITIPEPYTSENSTPLTATVPETGGQINLELSSKT